MLNINQIPLLLGQLFLILLSYKLFMNLSFSLWWVFSPIYGSISILALLMLIGYIQGKKVDKKAKEGSKK